MKRKIAIITILIVAFIIVGTVFGYFQHRRVEQKEQEKQKKEEYLLSIKDDLYKKIKKLKEEFVKVNKKSWTNITISIQNYRFMVEYDYEDLKTCEFNSYERHIIWRFKYLGIGPEQVSKKDKEILKKYILL